MGKTNGVIYGDPSGPSFGPARDNGVWVMAEKCATCIFRPGNLMDLKPGVVAEMKRGADEKGTCIICHEGMIGPNSAVCAVCAGYYENCNSALLQIAERMNVIKRQPVSP